MRYTEQPFMLQAVREPLALRTTNLLGCAVMLASSARLTDHASGQLTV